MRGRIVAVVIICFVCIMSPVSTYTISAASSDVGIVSPMALYTNQCYATLSINSGTAQASVSVMGINSVTRISMYTYLEQNTNNGWITVSNWSNSSNSQTAFAVNNAIVTSGSDYRVKVSCYVYVGAAYENIVSYSSVVTN